MPNVLLRQPGNMPLDLKTDVALLEQYRAAIAAQHGVTQSRLEAIPTGRQRTGDIAAIFVVHAKEGAEPMFFHHLARPFDAIFAEPVPIDPLLPVHAGDAEIRSHHVLPLIVIALVPTRASLPAFKTISRTFCLFSILAATSRGSGLALRGATTRSPPRAGKTQIKFSLHPQNDRQKQR